MADVFIAGDDGEFRPIGTANWIRYTVPERWPDIAPHGTCSQCCVVPLNGEPYVCEHGVTVGGSLTG